MASDIFLKIDGIKGDATDVDHQNEIEVVSWSWGVSEELIREGGLGIVGGKPKVGDFVIGKQLDKASPDILRACLTAKHIKEVVLTQRRAGAGTLNFLTITLNDVLISNVNDIEPNAASKPTESVVFGFFAKVIYEYVPLKPNGQPDTPVTLKWDVQASKEF
jgi:type VI secretion system secreted protein Hcp